MISKENNYAFIDSNNLNLSIRGLGWKLDFKKFRSYLHDKYNIQKALLFIGYAPGNEGLYAFLQEAGYICIFKPTLELPDGRVKGNVDAELVLHTMIELNNFDKAVIVSGDGDFFLSGRVFIENWQAQENAYSESKAIFGTFKAVKHAGAEHF